VTDTLPPPEELSAPDEWDQQMDALVAGSLGGAPKELSARGRQLEGRLVELDRARRLRERRGRKGLRRRVLWQRIRAGKRALAWFVVLAVLGGGAWFLVGRGGNGASAAFRAFQPPAVPGASTDGASLAAPFAGWTAKLSDGVAGLWLPSVHAVGSFSAADVAAALAQSRRYLVTANLDLSVVVGRDPNPVLELLTPDERQQLRADIAKPNLYHDPLLWMTRLSPAAVLVGHVIKVTGGLWLTETPQDLKVNYRLLFIYPVTQRNGSGEVLDIVVRRDGTFDFYRPYLGGQLQPLANASSYWAADGAQCLVDDQGLVHPAWATPVGPTPSAVPSWDIDNLLTAAPNQTGCMT
jgi:hypothetical protein